MAIITGTAAAEILNSAEQADQVNGLGGNDTLNGGGGDDTLNGGAGDDSMSGGDGNDVYYVQSAGDSVVETNADAMTGGVDTVYSYLGAYTLSANVENLRLMSGGAADATGNALANVLYAGAGDNVLNGGAGSDTASYQYAGSAVTVSLALAGPQATGGSGMDTLISIENLTGSAFNDTLSGSAGKNQINGGAGIDTVDYTGVFGGVTVDLGVSVFQATGGAGLDRLLNVENLTGGQGNDSLTGNAGANELVGGAGNDTLDGGAGSDTMLGGAGNDTVVIDSISDGVSEGYDQGIDTMVSHLSTLSLAANFENLVIASADDADGFGNDLDNVIFAGTGDNYMLAGLGNDTVSFRLGATSGVTASLATTASSGGSGTDTFIGFDNLEGSAFDDSLAGDGMANVIEGGAGDDTIDGAGGSDTASYAHAGGSVSVSLAIAGEQDTGGAGGDALSNIENLEGGNYNDSLTGSAGNNTLNGGYGIDTMTGGAGNDAYILDTANDVVVEQAGGGYDTVFSHMSSCQMADNVEVGSILSTGFAGMTGNSGDNLIYAGKGDNNLDGGAGNDTLSYGNAIFAVNVSLAIVGEAQNTAGSGTDALQNFEALTGSSFADTLTGSAGANTLDGGAGADTMTGGSGDDTYFVDNSGDVVVELAGGGNDRVNIGAAVGWTAGADIETISIITNSGATAVTGNILGNLFESAGGTQNSTYDGGGGFDTLSYATSGAGITLSLNFVSAQATGGSGTDAVFSIEALIGSGYNDSLSGSTGANSLDGGSGNDTLNGDAGNDTLTGGYGNDTMAGGTGDDIYYALLGTDTIVEGAGAGTDTVHTASSMTMAANVEIAVIAAGGSINVTGNTGANTILAGSGNNVINGDAGSDTVSYQQASGSVTVSLGAVGAQATGGSGSDTLSNLENITGSSFNDTLGGTNSDNVINGGIGADSMVGGAGNDTYYVDAVGDIVNELFNNGYDTVMASASHTLGNNLEYLRINTSANINATGNGGDNVIYNGTGNNVINGGAGVDTVSFYYATGACYINLNVPSSVNTLAMGSDTFTSIENVNGSSYNDTLQGSSDDNALNGGSGNDALRGGTGDDTLTGSYGDDTFYFNSTIGSEIDTITDLNFGGNDTIQLDNSEFTMLADGALSAGNFVIGTQALDGNDYLIYDNTSGALYYDADGSGAGVKQQFALLSDKAVLSAADFIVT